MSLNPGGQNYSWNYSRPDKDGYSLQLIGTVVSFQEIQAHKYNQSNPSQPGAPDFWDDGNPKMNIRMGLATETGELKAFVFTPAGKQAREGRKPSIHMDLFYLSGGNITNLIGKTIVLSTQEPPQGWKWGVGNPRPWHVELIEAGPFELSAPLPEEFKVPRLLADSAVSGGQIVSPQPQQQQQWQQQAQPQQQWQPQRQPQPRQQWQPQASQPVPQQQWNPQPQQWQPQAQPMQPQPVPQQQWAPQPQAQPMQPQPQVQPAGINPMDPQIVEAMQAIGATSYEVIPAHQPTGDAVGNGQAYGDVYDEDIPFDETGSVSQG